MIPYKTSINFLNSWAGAAKYPFKLTFSVTQNCNQRCKHCRVWEKKPEPEITLPEIRQVFEQYPHFSWIDLTGGEIFLRKDLEEIVTIISENSRRLEYLHFPTNGTVPETFERIREIRRIFNGNLVMTVSIDGDKPLHDKIRGREGSWEKAAELLEKLIGEKLRNTRVYAGMTLFKENEKAVGRTRTALETTVSGFKKEMLHINYAHESVFYNNMGTGVTAGYLKPPVLNGYSLFSFLDRSFNRYYSDYLKSGMCPVPCRSGEVSLHISAAGRLYPCTMWDIPGFPLKENDYSIHQILDSDNYKKRIEEIHSQQCDHCWTPCEAYQSILADIIRSEKRKVKS